jgi:hypothetical protein
VENHDFSTTGFDDKLDKLEAKADKSIPMGQYKFDTISLQTSL